MKEYTKDELFQFAQFVYRYWIAGSNFNLDELFEKWRRKLD